MSKKGRELSISPEAKAGFRRIQLYIRANFGKAKSEIYRRELINALVLVCQTPALFPLLSANKDTTIHKYVFKKKTIVLYYFDETVVHIVTITDSRSDWQTATD